MRALTPAKLDDAPYPSIDESLARARRVVGRRAGIVADVSFAETPADTPRAYFVRSAPADTTALTGQPSLAVGSAAALDPRRAIVKAVGESVERYCAALYDESALRLATFDELDDASPPESFAAYSERQLAEPTFGRDAFRPDTAVRWVEGWSLVDDCPRWVPAASVYVPYSCAAGEAAIWDGVSTGLAAGPTRAAALLRGVLEAVERDALMIVWQNRLACPAVDLDDVRDPDAVRLRDTLRQVPMSYEVFLLTLDLPVTTFLLVARSRTDEPPHLVLGLGTDLDPTRALVSALEEGLLSVWGLRALAAQNAAYRPEPGFADIADLESRAVAYALDPELEERTAFMREGGTTVSLVDLPDRSGHSPRRSLESLVGDLGRRGFDVVGIDLTTEDVDSVGYAVCRAVVPGLQPLDIAHTRRYLGGRRLYEVPVAIGRRDRALDEEHLNPDPHPFP